MKMIVQHAHDHVLLTLRGEFDSWVREPFLAAVEDLLAQGARRLRLDLLRVRFLTSSGVGAILRARRLCRRMDGELVLHRGSRAVRGTLEALALDTVLPIEDDALESLAD